jgi:DNA mismatch repair protein MLH3
MSEKRFSLPATLGQHAAINRFLAESHLATDDQQISREQLFRVQVISQIDRKFVSCLVESERSIKSVNSESVGLGENTVTLALVDQHAADERVRVESFLRPLCLGFLYSRSGGTDPAKMIPIIHLTPPRPALLARHDASVLKRNPSIHRFFKDWGISISEQSQNGVGWDSDTGCNGEYVQVFVTSLPEVVSDKVSLLAHREVLNLNRTISFLSFCNKMNSRSY